MARSKPTTTATPARPHAVRIRVIDYRVVPASELVVNRSNPRKHPPAQRHALQRSLQSIGFAGAELVRVRPEDGRLELIDGELRQTTLGDQPVPVLVTDLTEAEADELLASYDAVTLLAQYDRDRTDTLFARLSERAAETAHLLRVVTEHHDTTALLQALSEANTSAADDGDAGAGADGGPIRDDEADAAGEADDDSAQLDAGQDDGDDALYSVDEILDRAVAHFRVSGFPYPCVPPFMALQRLNQLHALDDAALLRSPLGTDIADTYHPHRYAATVLGQNSPLASFHDEQLLRRALRMRLEEPRFLHAGYPTTLNVVNHTQAAAQFRPGFALALYRRYCQPGAVVLDTSTGYGGRLVGYLASGLWRAGGTYIGIDPNTLTYQGNRQLAEDLGMSGFVELLHAPAEDVPHDVVAERCDFAFTSPPYFAKERYSDEETQSWRRYPTGEEWRDGFLRPMLALQFAALRPGAYAVINIDDVDIGSQHYPLVDWTLEDAADVGFVFVERLDFPLQTSFGAGHDHDSADSEPVLVFRKPAAIATDTPSSPAAVAARSSHPHRHGHQRTLLSWMQRLYALAADTNALAGDLGTWPVELGGYLERLCLAYSPDVARIRLASDLIVRPALPSPGTPIEPRTCLLLFSGGKDSFAAGLLAERQGYDVHAVYVRKVNGHSYPTEREYAKRIADYFGWRYTELVPQHLPKSGGGEALIKNQFILAYALDKLGYTPGAYAFGSYALDDCHTTSWYSDMEVAFRAFDETLRAVYGDERAPRRLDPLEDELHALRVWCEAPAQVRALTASCMMPARNKPQHRQRNLDAEVPLLEYDCGSCEKCYSRAVLLTFVWHPTPDVLPYEYPKAYLSRALKRLSQSFVAPLWTHAHTQLESPALPAGTSARHLLEHVYGGALKAQPRVNTQPAIAPVIER